MADTRITHERDLAVPLPGGAVGRADRWGPARDRPGPVVLVRSPYGRRGPWGLLYGRWLARGGWSVVVASCRGTERRGDRLEHPMVHEAADGAATVAWLRTQPWWDGRLATIGLSYMGFAQWALATDPPDELRAVVVQVGPHTMGPTVWPGGALSLADTLGWAQQVTGSGRQLEARAALGEGRRRAALARAARPGDRPLREADVAATGAPVPWWRAWVEHPWPAPWWDPYDAGAALARLDVPVLLQGGWHDLFRRQTLEQHVALAARGVPVATTVGPWTHTGLVRAWPRLMAEARGWLAAAFEGRTPPGAGHVRSRAASSGGRQPWRTWPSWPPPGATAVRWAAEGATRLRRGDPAPGAGGVPLARIRWDPRHPTPSLGGAVLGPGAGAVDNRDLLARPDVAAWTSEPLPAGLEVAGPVRAEVEVTSSGPHDLFARLLAIRADGTAVNLCDGIATRPASGPGRTSIDLGPVAASVRPGERLGLLLAGGAHPRYAAHPGRHGPLATTTAGPPVDLEVVAATVELLVIGP